MTLRRPAPGLSDANEVEYQQQRHDESWDQAERQHAEETGWYAAWVD
jgi:hypothetical protein